jgi:hypothetical protein
VCVCVCVCVCLRALQYGGILPAVGGGRVDAIHVVRLCDPRPRQVQAGHGRRARPRATAPGCRSERLVTRAVYVVAAAHEHEATLTFTEFFVVRAWPSSSRAVWHGADWRTRGAVLCVAVHATGSLELFGARRVRACSDGAPAMIGLLQ